MLGNADSNRNNQLGPVATRMQRAEGKAPKTVQIYTEAVAWFAAAHLLPEAGKTTWAQVSGQDGPYSQSLRLKMR